jgi:hypothetical protein
MEYTKNKLSPEIKKFYKKLSEHIDEKIYFYGSIQRLDYLPEYSDIDIHIFSENVHETINKLSNYLHINKKDEVQKIAIYLANTKNMIYGYKIEYTCKKLNFNTEITVYNIKYKSATLQEDIAVINIPFLFGIVLYIIKFLYYKLQILNKKQYQYYKCNLINNYLYTQFSDRDSMHLIRKALVRPYDNVLFNDMM